MKTIKPQQFHDAVAPSPELIHLRARNSQLEHQVATLQEQRGKQSEAMTRVLEAVEAAEPPKITFKADTKRAGSEVAMVAHATDWHIGAVTNPAHVEEFGEFSWKIAKERVELFASKLIDKATTMRQSYRVSECHVIGTADWVSGDIHEELVRTNEFPAPVQAVNAGFLLGQFISTLAPHFKIVHAHILNAGNHDRITRKPQCEQGGVNSWGYVTTAIAGQYLSRIENVHYRAYEGSSFVANVAGTRYLCMHGDGIPAHMGVPHFGMDRLVMREALRRMHAEEKKFDAVVCGHWHVANNLMFCRYGGSLSGTTAHDHKYARNARPHQTGWFVHPKHGDFDWTRWYL